MASNWKSHAAAEQSASHHFAVTPHDSTNFTYNCRALYIGGEGDVVVVTEDGTAVTYVGVPAGSILPVVAKRVNSTNTTATDIVGMY